MWIDRFGLKKSMYYRLGRFQKHNGSRISCEFWPGFWTLPVLKVGLWILSYEVLIIDFWSAWVGMLVFYPLYFFFWTRLFKFGFGIVSGILTVFANLAL